VGQGKKEKVQTEGGRGVKPRYEKVMRLNEGGKDSYRENLASGGVVFRGY